MTRPKLATTYASNIGLALVVALALTLLGLSWFDLFGYWQFTASLRNL